jgi:membrane fusion protein, heavy metal efflux system
MNANDAAGSRKATFSRFGGWIVLLAVAAVLAFVGWNWLTNRKAAEHAEGGDRAAPLKLASGRMDSLLVNPETARAMGLTAVPVGPAPAASPLKLFGSLFLDSSRLVHVRTRFAGEVIEVGQIAEPTPEGGPSHERPLQVGDAIKRGQVLAVIWSKEIGERKSDLVDAQSQLYLHEKVLQRLKSLQGGPVSERAVEEATRNYEADVIQVTRLERTLRSWQLSEETIAAMRAEAKRIHEGKEGRNPQLDREWAELDVVAPQDGVVLERNFTVGDIVDPTQDLFKLADISRLSVLANAYEEDLPKLRALTTEQRRWSLRLQSETESPPLAGTFEAIGNVIDQSQHTAIVRGWIENPDQRLRVGQFVTATVELPTSPGEVAVPVTAIVDDGADSYLFVAKDEALSEVTRRQVQLVRRTRSQAILLAHPPAGNKGPQPIRPGELVVGSGTIELNGALRTLATQQPLAAQAAEARP